MSESLIPHAELFWLAGSLLLAGAATGILAGLFGIGGGAIIVPVLFEVFTVAGVDPALRMHLAVGTSLAIIIPTALGSYRAHRARSAVRSDALRRWAVPVVLGVLAGTALASVSPDRVLKVAFVAFAGLMSMRLLFGRESWVLGDELPGRGLMSAYGFGVGLTSPLIGISGGGIASVILTLYRVPIHQAIATSAGLGVLIAIPGAIGYVIGGLSHLAELPPLSLGYVSIPGALLVGGVATLTAPLGARLAHAFTRRQLEIGFGIYLFVIGARFAWQLLA
ncbi:sulfite exporter TauE/SafE family protein [Ancylobacter sp. 6x-1]|uniref:Probable membrane transporter protein n=1 Tax=Ancylobacter crimeensis TaxID=2579147 RepID=A0ABT0D8F0_9HYPH|nr:sulfite exporter TauE/SafE family protein [Ancylobacter crimeensis]MCK0196194.1 sulfite exporter TauE/SafE family protein [Ancylobacter crimeensis]